MMLHCSQAAREEWSSWEQTRRSALRPPPAPSGPAPSAVGGDGAGCKGSACCRHHSSGLGCSLALQPGSAFRSLNSRALRADQTRKLLGRLQAGEKGLYSAGSGARCKKKCVGMEGV